MENCAYLRKNPGYAPDLQKEVATVRRLPVTEKNKVSLFITLNLTNTHDLRKEGIMKNALTSTVGRFCQKNRDAEQ